MLIIPGWELKHKGHAEYLQEFSAAHNADNSRMGIETAVSLQLVRRAWLSHNADNSRMGIETK